MNNEPNEITTKRSTAMLAVAYMTMVIAIAAALTLGLQWGTFAMLVAIFFALLA